MRRNVDAAMAADRPEKITMRRLWVEEVRLNEERPPPEPVPLYCTMPGERGADISALVEAGVIDLAESGAVADARSMRVIAIEQSPSAVVELQKRFPGLKVLEQPLQDLLHSTSLVAWPVGEHRRLFRAQVINLDLNSPLAATVDAGQLLFPLVRLIRKLAVLHAEPPQVEWTLCLTLHGELEWDGATEAMTCQFLATNFAAAPPFSEGARGALGPDLHEAILQRPDRVGLSELEPAEQQRLLMVLVPKRIAFEAHREGWAVETVHNLRYGGTRSRARMVSWVLRFRWDERVSTHPNTVYQESLNGTLVAPGRIDERGTLIHE